MVAAVNLWRLANELGAQFEGYHYYLHKPTGEVAWVSIEALGVAEELEQDANEEELDDEIVEALKILESDEYLELPAKSEIHEWNIMRQFCNSIEDARLRRSLLDAIHGAGAFGLFRHLIDEHDITEDWYAFRQSALESIAVGWLEANKIPYTRGKPQAGTLATDDD